LITCYPCNVAIRVLLADTDASISVSCTLIASVIAYKELIVTNCAAAPSYKTTTVSPTEPRPKSGPYLATTSCRFTSSLDSNPLGSLNWNYVGKLIAYIIALDVELFD
jgi:hypothetical protein